MSTAAGSQHVTVGETVTIAGKLTCPSAGEAAEQELTVYQQASGSSSVVGTATTEADGSYRFQSAPINARGVFIVRYSGAPHGARVVVRAAAEVSLQGPAADGAALAMRGGKAAGGSATATFSGVVYPEEPGRLVGLKVSYAGGEWRTVAFTRTDATGRYTFTHSFRFAGDVSVIVGARPRGVLLTKSQPLNYTIVQAQNPALTIQSSPPSLAAPDPAADPLAAAEQTTITGVVVGPPRQTVTLLSRTPTGRFASVATVASDDAGAYSFTVDPAQTTIYRVVCGKLHSTLVRIEVN